MTGAAEDTQRSNGAPSPHRKGSLEQVCGLEVRAAEFNPVPEVQLDRQALEIKHSDVDHDLKPGVEEPAREQVEPRRICGLPLKKFRVWLLVCATILALIATVVGTPDYISTTGVMNGSGVVALDVGDGSSRIILYSQHYNGEIRKSEYLGDTWTGGQHADVVEVVASNARNGTPLMAVSFSRHQELIWRVFYVDNNDYLQESLMSNKTQGGWSTGLLGAGRHKASDSNRVGLTACHNSQWYGAPYNSSGGGLRLYYGANNHTVQELLWADGNGAWDYGTNFPDSNGDGGVECTVAHSNPPSITNLWLINSNNELEQLWFDFNASAQTSNHTTGTWVKGRQAILHCHLPTILSTSSSTPYLSIRNSHAVRLTGLTYSTLYPNTGITAITTSESKLIHFQLSNNTVREVIATGTGETSRWAPYYLDINEEPALPGSRLGSVILNTAQGGQEIHVFYQTNGSDISEFVRTLDGGSWAVRAVPIGP
ncbi:MAG: hypothetical protein M1830_005080 [Pleopsidium flavum]|nr:MAG: hypothetical protein M1830_005080 [Pleopsidium flavum]